jgi:hypothetical protein
MVWNLLVNAPGEGHMAKPANNIDPADIEAIVRTYLGRMARRYMPLLGALLVLILLATLVPSRSPVTNVTAAQGTTPTTVGDGTSPVTSAPGTSGNSTSVGGGTGPVTVGGGAFTPPAVAGSRGVARSGVSCGPGVRQVTWTVYVPLCTPKYTGNNGGKRYRGVTKDKIMAFYRHARSAQDSAINAALGSANLDDDKYISDLNTYIGFFNKQFELYGRHVEMYVYDGKADYLNEDQGIEQSGNTQADAQNAVDHDGFVDLTFPLKGSYPFWQALADRKALTLGPAGFPKGWYAERSPYWYSSLPTGTGVASWVANMVCRRMVGMNASFAGDPTFKVTKRVFGLVHPDNPEYIEIGKFIKSSIAKCGVHLNSQQEISYPINVAMMPDRSAAVIAQLNAQHVSTVLCYCDPIFPIFLTQSADGQRYNPEWWMPGWGDAQAQTMSQRQWPHAVVIGAKYPARKDDQAYKVFKMIKPNAEPAGPYYAVSYGVALLLFDALQAAGPDLTPTGFQKGWFSLGSISGPAGTLVWKPGNFSPIVSAPMSWWKTNATSNFNGKQGAYENCGNGKFLPFDLSRASEWGSGPVSCFK